MGYSKTRRERGAPMKRNFGIGAPSTDETVGYVDPSINAGINKDSETTTTPSPPPPPPEQTYLEKENINPDGTKTIEGRRDGLTGGLLDNWIRKNQGKSFLEVLKLDKKSREERKNKRELEKTTNLANANKAIEDGTATLKQIKLVDKNKEKEEKKRKKEKERLEKEKIKIAKYNKRKKKRKA